MTSVTERLVNTRAATNRAEARLIELLVATDPVAISPENKRRSWAAVTARPTRRGTTTWVRGSALALGLAVAATAAAADGLAGRWWAHLSGAKAPPSVQAVAGPTAQRAVVHGWKTAVPLSPPPERIKSSSRAADRPWRPLRSPRPPRHAVVAAIDDPGDVVQAIRALRQDHDAGRAAELLAGYLRVHPSGALSEEALALSIEAATARHNPAAASLSRRYLTQYPTGRFREYAEKQLAGTQARTHD